MRISVRYPLAALLLFAATLPIAAMELVWTRPAAQYRSEATPLVVDFDGDGAPEILSVNLGGQVLLWETDGTPIGTGQDGMIAQLPEGRWTSQPVQLFRPEGPLVVFGSVEGNLVALDRAWAVAWQHALGAETTWSRAVPAVVAEGGKTLLCIGDASGKITSLDATGAVAWSTALESGPSRAMVKAWTDGTGKTLLLASAGETLFALDTTGAVQWQRALGGEIISQAEVFATPESTRVLCGTRAGSLFALNPGGEIAWEAKVGGEIDTSITFLPREGKTPLILCTGVWGNLHAIEPDGTRAWTHIFDTKNRAHPVVLDANGDGTLDVLVATYDQRLLVFNAEGLLIDEVRLSGLVNASPVLVPGEKAGESDLVVFSNVLLAHRFHPGLAVSPYGATGRFKSVQANIITNDQNSLPVSYGVKNPDGALMTLNVLQENRVGPSYIQGMLTAKSLVEMVLATELSTPPGAVWDSQLIAVYRSANDAKAGEDTFYFKHAEPAQSEESGWTAGAALQSDGFAGDSTPDVNEQVLTETLYQNESGHVAFVVSNHAKDPIRLRAIVPKLLATDGQVFAGNLRIIKIAPVATANGEKVADALVPIESEGQFEVLPGETSNIWLNFEVNSSLPGKYSGTITIQPLNGDRSVGLDFGVNISPLGMPDQFPLKLCTWDYIPNQWFPNHPEAVLDGMGEHGVNIFPRTTVPTAIADASGKLTIDWAALDVELDRLKGRGELLLQVADAPVTWPEGFPEALKRSVKLDYLRQLRDHLKDHGRVYGDYALYPVDEPGLDYGPRVPIYVDAAELFREADPKFRIYTDPVPGLSWRDFERIDPLVDVWCPNMRLVNGLLVGDPRIQRIMDSGKPVWSYECVSQVKSLSPLAYNRANAWRAWYFGLQGIGLWTFSTTQADHWLANADVNDEYALVYPGDMPVASVRWEALRDGLEDVAAMAMLKERIEANRDKPEKATLVKEAEEALRIATVDVMELSANAFMESRDFRAQGNRRIWHTRADELLFRTHRVTFARLTLELGE
jgi:outer membrane protein assembly factor BamB